MSRQPLLFGLHIWTCGWCNHEVASRSAKLVHVKLLWHQWWVHRERIFEEYPMDEGGSD